jgi:hypothetical protein
LERVKAAENERVAVNARVKKCATSVPSVPTKDRVAVKPASLKNFTSAPDNDAEALNVREMRFARDAAKARVAAKALRVERERVAVALRVAVKARVRICLALNVPTKESVAKRLWVYWIPPWM